MWLIILIMILIVALMLLVALRRGLQMRTLVLNGVPADATVIKKLRFRGKSNVSTYRFRYEFQAGDGKRYSHAVALPQSDADAYDVGSVLKIIYLPNKPRISALSSMVELARNALNKP